jgi:hypothetical protein
MFPPDLPPDDRDAAIETEGQRPTAEPDPWWLDA